MTDSLSPLGIPTRSTDPLDRSYGRTDGRTYAEPQSPTSETSSSVTHARTYEISPSSWTDAATTDYQTQLRTLRDVARKAKTR